MVELVVIGFVAGIVAGISPCILPVLPVILVAGATSPDADGRRRPSWMRPLAVVVGLIVSFSVVILVGSEVLSALGLPQDLLTDVGIALLVLVGLGFLVPQLATLLERPFARIGGRQPKGTAGGFVVGLGLGVLFAPCAGPILAAITLIGTKHRVGFTAVILTAAFAAGAGVPLLAVALAGGELTRRVSSLRRRAPRVRQFGGVVLIVMALTIGFNVFSGLQRDVPGYTSSLQNQIEGSGKVRKELSSLTGESHAPLDKCSSTATSLINCGPAPDFTGITTWLNTPDGEPLSLAGLKGKVVLVDFWTYSCINCQRTLPHVEAWYRDYAPDGLVVVGVHTPEFAFEHVVSNVRSQAAALGVHYPVAIDNDYDTWTVYGNEYWPAEYLIDAEGDVRHISFGEGDYSDTESLIRQLLSAAHPGITLPPATDVANKTPTEELSPETYVGYDEEQYIVNPTLTKDAPALYQLPQSVPLGGLALSGTWTEGAQEATAGPNASLVLGFLADDVYLVMGGLGTVHVAVNGKPTTTVEVGGVPKLYTLFQASSTTTAGLSLSVSPGVQVYDFTFG